MNVRRSAAIAAALVALGVVASPAALAAPTPSPSGPALPEGLYGKQDPTYDGVWRQSLALTALGSTKSEVPVSAVRWLTGQQCADGAFAPYRAEPDQPCGPKDKTDSNSTAAAVQALAAIGGHEAQAGKAVRWLKSTQNADGGWSYNPGGPSDANSTSVVVGALLALGEKPAATTSKKGRSPEDALLGFALKCGADKGEGAAFAYQPDAKSGKLSANDDATAAAVTAAFGHGFHVPRASGETGEAATCAAPKSARDAARNGAAHLASSVAKSGHLMSAMPGAEDQPDVGNTADTAVALAAAGLPDEAAKPMKWLEKNGPAWAEKTGPAAWAQLILAVDAAGGDYRAFGGTDLVTELKSGGPSGGGLYDTAAESKDDKSDDGKDDGISPWWMVGVGLAAGAGVGFLISSRNKKKNAL